MKPVQLLKTAFVVYEHADLQAQRQFLLDFGMRIADERPGKEIFFSGYGSEPYIYVARQSQDGKSRFRGGAYVVESRSELEKANKEFGGTAIAPLDGPAGGEIVTLTDPAGHQVHLIHGWKEKAPEPQNLKKLVFNYEDEKPRKGQFQRFDRGPASVYRWGHYGVTYQDGTYDTMYNWYVNTISLASSDIVYRGEQPVTCFFRIDRGIEYTDHHSFFFKPAKPNEPLNVAHAAFEVHDFDSQHLAHDFLASKGYELCWGVGRHVLGSQIFDYWFDTSKFVVEHYADGDLVNSETPVKRTPAGPQSLAVWGPPVPSVF